MDFGLRTFLEGVEFKREKILCMVENRKGEKQKQILKFFFFINMQQDQ